MFFIYDCLSNRFVCKRRNVSYDLFTDDFSKARLYKTRSHAVAFARAIKRARSNEKFLFVVSNH